MKNKVITGIILTLLLTSIAWGIVPVYGPPGGVVHNVPTALTPTVQAAILIASPNDEIHVAAKHSEVLAGPVNIWQPNLWIIGAPPTHGPPPKIDLAGFTITIAASGVFIWGLNIIDTWGAMVGIDLIPGSGKCIIRNNTIACTGGAIGFIGIQVWSADNRIELNNMSWWETCIDLTGTQSTGNIVVGNTFGLWGAATYGYGVQVSGGAGFNEVYYNNLWTPGWIELWDANPPGSPPNAFDDSTFVGSPNLFKGNFEVTWAINAPYPVQPGTNGYFDFWPWVVPWTQLQGDVILDDWVNIVDIVFVALGFGVASWCQLLWDPRRDLDGNGVINIVDVVIIGLNFNAKGC